jgi:PPOX class probable FMN-dependent enzyme
MHDVAAGSPSTISRWEELPTIRSASELEQFGVPEPVVRDKVESRLAEEHREWIAGSPFVVVATSSRDGSCDVSPKGDPPGFVKVLDDTTLAIPERSGNRRMDGFHNVVENPHAGLLFLIPGRPETLRVNGTARIVTEGPFLDDMLVRGHRPVLALLVTVEEAFFHCPKALARSKAWKPDSWVPDAVRPYAAIAHGLWRRGEALEAIEARNAPDVIEAELYPST